MPDYDNSRTALPDNWVWTTLDAVVDTTRQRRLPQEYPDLPYIGLENIESETMRLLGTQSASELKSMADYFEAGDVLYARLRPYLNKVYRPDFEGLCSSEFIIFRNVDNLDNKYVQYLINSWNFVFFAMGTITGDRPRVGMDDLGNFQFPLAPLNEQHRIVDEIEAQFSRLDTWLDVMQKLREQLPRLRASILKAVVEGRLVEQDPDDEPADVLLQRILDERRHRWEEEYLADLEAKGRSVPKDDKWKAKYLEPEAPDTDDLPKLPRGWVWARLEQLIYAIDAGKSVRAINRPAEAGEYGVLKVSAVSWGKFQSEENKALFSDYIPDPDHLVRYNDLIVSRANTVELVGAVVLVQEENDNLMLSDKTLRLVPASDEVLKTYLVHAMRSHFVRNYYEPLATGTSDSMRNLAQGKILGASIPLPPVKEQTRIVDDLERRFSVIESLEAVVQVNIKRAERMRQSVLKKAFEGRLVEQDPNDEPASELLVHIQEERQRRTEEQKQKPRQQRERKMNVQTERKSLYATLKEAGKPLSAPELFQQAGFTHATIDDFYEELREAVHELQTIRSRRNKNNEVYLEVTG